MTTQPKIKKPAKKRTTKTSGSRKSGAGRPTKMTEATIKKLEDAFLLGCSDLEACFAADISTVTFYKYCQKNPEFLNRKERLKQNPVFKARGVLIEALDDKDVATAHKVIERKDGVKSVIAGDKDNPLHIKSQSITTEMDPTEAARLYADLVQPKD